jgi:hypothetical protein
MDSSLANKIYKARIYAEEPERFTVIRLEVEMRGDDRMHRVALADERWSCDCEYFRGHATCAHTMALQRVLEPLALATK